jgi:hypothetical protein
MHSFSEHFFVHLLCAEVLCRDGVQSLPAYKVRMSVADCQADVSLSISLPTGKTELTASWMCWGHMTMAYEL